MSNVRRKSPTKDSTSGTKTIKADLSFSTTNISPAKSQLQLLAFWSEAAIVSRHGSGPGASQPQAAPIAFMLAVGSAVRRLQ
jgi:hypothetical protein